MKLLKVGLALGGFGAVVHGAWSSLVAFGYAQPFLDWILSLHFLNNPFVVQPFVLASAIKLIALVFVFGFVYGVVFGALWNVAKKIVQ